jgi:hypothetical protein
MTACVDVFTKEISECADSTPIELNFFVAPELSAGLAAVALLLIAPALFPQGSGRLGRANQTHNLLLQPASFLDEAPGFGGGISQPGNRRERFKITNDAHRGPRRIGWGTPVARRFPPVKRRFFQIPHNATWQKSANVSAFLTVFPRAGEGCSGKLPYARCARHVPR